MRWEFAALPWEQLGERPAMVTLTYPADWRNWCPDARTFARHRKALQERWRRRFGPAVGVWVAEFQPRANRPVYERNAPHLHLYVGLPDAMSDKEYSDLVARKMRRLWLERRFGSYEARRRTRAPRGEFSDWLLLAWWEIVGSGRQAHRYRGVDIVPAFGSREIAVEADRGRVADYFWRESGKWAQKETPEGFGSLKFYDRWGEDVGFVPRWTNAECERDVYCEVRRVARRWREQKHREAAAKQAERLGRPVRTRRMNDARGLDGLSVFDVSDAKEWTVRLLRWAESTVEWKASHDVGRPVSERALARLEQRIEARRLEEERRLGIEHDEEIEWLLREHAREAIGW